MKNFKLIYLIFCLTIFSGCSPNTIRQSSLLQYDAKINHIIRQMTLEEKIAMLHGKHMFVSAGVKRLGVADMHYVDGPFGIREELQPDGWGSLGWETDRATFFPTGSALAATWSPELAYAYGTGMAREARLRGKDMILGPAINIQRIPTGGRTFEYLSEDPFLSSRLSVGYINGVQDNGVAACVKHYALNNQENNRGSVDVIVDERAMREIYFPPFKASVVEADAYGIMAAYNKVNGWWASESDMLLNKVLRDDWGFAGMVISDWTGTHSTVNAITNGLNVEMPTDKFLGKPLLEAVRAGTVSEDLINQRVREILRVRMAIKPIPPEQANVGVTSRKPQQKIAYDVAAKSIVLLKNSGILPLTLEKKPTIAVIGANATQAMASGGMGTGVKTLYEVTPLEGLRNRIGSDARVVYAKGYEPVVYRFSDMFEEKSPQVQKTEAREKRKVAQKLAQEAIEVAASADIVLFIGGNNRAVETEGSDRRDIKLPSGQDGLIQEIAKVNANIVTILTSGAPNDLNVIKPLSKALLISWFNGTEGGNALADTLLGKISPSGRLPFTFPVKLEDSPAYALGNYPQGQKANDIFANLVAKTESDITLKNEKVNEAQLKNADTAFYSEGSLMGYRWFDTKSIPIMYPFGHGLTYTTFEYSDLKTDKGTYTTRDTIKLFFTLENTGTSAAEEVVQGYVHRVNPSVEWPVKELKAFSRVQLDPGETRSVTLEIPVEHLRYWNQDTQTWSDDLCDIELLIGASAGDIRLKRRITLK
ncbi:glycosyl hydrolase [Exilibacterium tricleocarpae]|uniref:Beta-D-glucoside glucohydrolase n=1 Tax=Exilibacterium tricleocarpae TaxID=2591008 RepID=A0A545TFF1_9GAMM|nr:glycoside hydrolase family 3 C-terminal domain-containing protein [Exilibacterium tricleocarpae]TQV75959.1 glycosyl hydrolase [Exilibacterium tricleocarpae]